MTALLSSGFVDSFRYLHPDAVGAYSWWSYRYNARKNKEQEEIDHILDKIRKSGYDSLSEKEKRKLFENGKK